MPPTPKPTPKSHGGRTRLDPFTDIDVDGTGEKTICDDEDCYIGGSGAGPIIPDGRRGGSSDDEDEDDRQDVHVETLPTMTTQTSKSKYTKYNF